MPKAMINKIKQSKYFYNYLLIGIFSLINNRSIAQEFWIPTTGPKGVSECQFICSNPDKIYTYVGAQGLFKSINGGKSWKKIIKGRVPYLGREPKWVMDKNENMYAYSNDSLYILRNGKDSCEFLFSTKGSRTAYLLNVNNKNVIFLIDRLHLAKNLYSVDGGKSFIQSTTTFEPYNYINYTTVAEDDNNFAVTSGRKIIKFSDRFTNVKTIYTAKDDPVFLSYLNGYIFFIVNYRLYKCNADGTEHQEIKTPNPYIIHLKKIDNNKLLIVTDKGDFVSHDFGNNWKSIKSNLGKWVTYNKNDLFFNKNDIILRNRNSIRTEFKKSKDGGTSWIKLDTFWNACDVREIQVTSNGKLLAYGSTNREFYYSNDQGRHWQTGIDKFNDEDLYSIGITSNGKLWAGNFNNLFYSIDHGKSFQKVNEIKGKNIKGLTDGDSLIYITSDNAELVNYLSYDGGKTWKIVSSYPSGCNYLTKLSSGAVFLCDIWDYFYINYPKKSSWEQVRQQKSKEIRNLFVTRSEEIFFTAEIEGKAWRGLYSSNNLFSDVKLIQNKAYTVKAEDSNGNLYALYSNRIFISNDKGMSWNPYVEANDKWCSDLGMDKKEYLYLVSSGHPVYRSRMPLTQNTNK